MNMKSVRDIECIGKVIRFHYPPVHVNRMIEGILQKDILEFTYNTPEDAQKTFDEIHAFMKTNQLA